MDTGRAEMEVNDKTAPPRRQQQSLLRETQAERALEMSAFKPGARMFMVFTFLGILSIGFVAALTVCVGGGQNGSTVSAWKALNFISFVRRFEKQVEDQSPLVRTIRPGVQKILLEFFGEGNSQVVLGREGWLFFKKDIDYVGGRPFLDPAVQSGRVEHKGIQANPLAAIVDFKRQLEARGIRLLVVPVPVKPSIEGHQLSRVLSAKIELRQNASWEDFLTHLQREGVDVFDPGPFLVERRKQRGQPQYLARDTHWTPPAMEAVAGAISAQINGLFEVDGSRVINAFQRPYRFVSSMESARGDTQALLGLRADESTFGPETVETRAVSVGESSWKASPNAEVLLLGDSFSNIYSLREMHWGGQAGFAEHLSAALGRPVDAILRNSDGAFATREMLQQEMARGRDRLAGKKVVVWEFAARELAFGDWKVLRLQLGEVKPAGFYCPPAGLRAQLEGTVFRLSSVPRQGATPYREHIMSVHLVDVSVAGEAAVEEGRQCLVYTWSLKDQNPSTAAFLRPGDRVQWEVVNWEDVQASKEKFQRSELEDPNLLAAPFVWAE
jgi:alginate O-acetyltransferase complex protein AlgJ